MTDSEGADTFLPFSNAKKLFDIINQKLGITLNGSFKQFCEILAGLNITLEKKTVSAPYTGGSNSAEFDISNKNTLIIYQVDFKTVIASGVEGSLSITVKGDDTVIYTNNQTWEGTGTGSIPVNEIKDISKYNKLSIYCSSTYPKTGGIVFGYI